MLRLLQFDCPERHQSEIELSDSLGADRVSSICPVCGAPGQSRPAECSSMAAHFPDELPPAPLARAESKPGLDEATGALHSIDPPRAEFTRDPPPIGGYKIKGKLGCGWSRDGGSGSSVSNWCTVCSQSRV